MNVIIPVNIYSKDIMLSVAQTNDEIKSALEVYGIIGEGAWLFENEFIEGRSMVLPNNAILLRLKYMPEDMHQHGLLAHELFHCVSYILHGAGIPLDQSSEEAWAYLIGYITKLVYSNLFAESE